MKVSEAIDLGRTIETPGDHMSYKTCALGVAMAAMGIPKEERSGTMAGELWPWICPGGYAAGGALDGIQGRISFLYAKVAWGFMTMDELIARVREYERVEEAAGRSIDSVECRSETGTSVTAQSPKGVRVEAAVSY